MKQKSATHISDEDRGHSHEDGHDAFESHDARDMYRLGKKQELRRNFELFSIVGFVSILQATWESTLLASSFGLYNGGSAGVIWLTVICWLCFLAMIASMAEMVSSPLSDDERE